MDALDIAYLVQQLQEERAAVALNNFLLDDDSSSTHIDSIRNITDLTKSDLDEDDLNRALNLTTRQANPVQRVGITETCCCSLC